MKTWSIAGAYFCSLAILAAGQPTETPIKGSILLLKNDRVLEGDIERAGDDYRVRRDGGETVIPAPNVKQLCADWDEVYAFMKSQLNLGDPDERLRLARWCQVNGLARHALTEATAAVEMRPTHTESKQLQELLRRAVENPTTDPKSTKAAASSPPPVPQVDLSSEAMTLFSRKVQPILMNTCAGCHSGPEAGAFRLHRPIENGAWAATQRNLAAVLAQLDFEYLDASPLLVKAVSAHGKASQPPLRDRRVTPFLTLQHWAQQLSATNPQLRRPARSTSVSPPAVPREPITTAADAKAPEIISRPQERIEIPMTVTTGLPMPMVSPATKPGPIPAPGVDPFDPELFNKLVPSTPNK